VTACAGSLALQVAPLAAALQHSTEHSNEGSCQLVMGTAGLRLLMLTPSCPRHEVARDLTVRRERTVQFVATARFVEPASWCHATVPASVLGLRLNSVPMRRSHSVGA
jgi:hypothetical protein